MKLFPNGRQSPDSTVAADVQTTRLRQSHHVSDDRAAIELPSEIARRRGIQKKGQLSDSYSAPYRQIATAAPSPDWLVFEFYSD